MKQLLSLCLAMLVTASASAQESSWLDDAIKNPARSKANIKRDIYRHPKETLEFFGLKPDMKVAEIWPGGGWYSEILAPALKDEGVYYAAHFDPEGKFKYYKSSREKFANRIKTDPAFAKVNLTTFSPSKDFMIAPKNSLDMVLTFRNVHNWFIEGDTELMKKAFEQFHAVLKPGGVLGVVEHRLPRGLDQLARKRSGYMKESLVIQMAVKAGFVFAEKSDINANPNDTAKYENGVWTLPPRLALGDKDKEKYLAIGESDRMTLKFVKPFAM